MLFKPELKSAPTKMNLIDDIIKMATYSYLEF